MKLQKIILCAAVALAAFGFSLGLFELGSYLRTALYPAKTEFKIKPPIPASPVVYQSPVVESKQAEYTPPETSISDEVCEWNETGDYSLLDENPKGFEDFETLSIVTRIYSEKYPNGIAVKPQGSIQTSQREFKFTWINITGKRISFVTETKKSVSYQFDGKFVEKIQPTDEENDYPELKGRLTKWLSGKKIAESKVEFGIMCGC